MPSQPQYLGRYQLLERISLGGMAEVFRAKAVGESGFEKMVALKRILPHMADDREFINMFIDEAKTIAHLNHVNICQVIEFGEESGTYYIALELVEGKDLKRMMEYHRIRGRAMPLPVVLYILQRICEALDYAHSRTGPDGRPMGIVHRDVSPQNVLISYAGDVKVIDFGIAKAVGRLTKTVSGTIKGKFGYMSPEQVMGQPLDRRSDIFACGTLLYEMATNTRLFKGESDIVTMQLVRRAHFRPAHLVNPQLPEALGTILSRALHRDPVQRYSTAGEMLDDLEQLAVDTDNACSAHQLARWINETFAQDREKARARARAAEERASQSQPSARAAGDGQDVELDEELAPTTISSSGTGHLAAEATGPGTRSRPDTGVSGLAPVHTYTETEYVSRSSAKAWILVGVLATLLVLGTIAVVVFWPTRGPTPTASAPTPASDPAHVAQASPPPPDQGPPPDTAPRTAAARDAGAPPRHARATARQRRAHRHRPRRRHRPAARKPEPPPAKTPARPPARPQPRPRRRIQKKGILVVASRPWARVWVDGRDTGRNTPIPMSSPLRLSPGRHSVSLLVQGRKFTYHVTIRPGETTKLIKKLPLGP